MKIVNPVLIYLAGIVEDLDMWLFMLSLLALSIALVCFVYYMFKFETYKCFGGGTDTDIVVTNENDKEKRKACNKEAKRSLTIGIILIILCTLVPNKETIYTIAVFDTLTVENIQSAGETGKEMIDYVVDQIDRIVNGGRK